MIARVPQGLLIAFLLLASASAASPKLPAFPGAEGYGKYATGGRGGGVYHVTTLADDGPGSLRQGLVSADAPRTIVFDVAGTITLKKPLRLLKQSNLTIAGQTSPGKGITLRDWPLLIDQCHDLVIRYLRIRLGDRGKQGSDDSMTVNRCENLILDHLSLSWGVDGNSDYRANANMTLQWLIYAEALHQSVHEKGAHAMCTSIRDCTGNTSVHHNIYATSRHRHPTLGSGSGRTNPEALIDFRNCVDYNWSGPTNLGGMKINFISNLYRPGPLSDEAALPIQMKDANLEQARGFLAGNVFQRMPAVLTEDNFAAVLYTNTGNYSSTTRERWAAEREFPTGEYAVPAQTAEEAYAACLRASGCSLLRDVHDERLVRDIRARQGQLLNSQSEVGGWDPYPEAHREADWDTDGDGMPDAWERAHGLAPTNPADRNAAATPGGYTNLETYLNGLVP